MKRIVVFASGSGTTFLYLLEHLSENIQICMLYCDRECRALELAKEHQIPVERVDQKLLENLKALNPDLIVLAGYLQKIESDIVAEFSNRMINIHPSLLPKYGGKGFYGESVHQAVFEQGDSYSGASVHYVSDEVDGGKIIDQVKVCVQGLSAKEIQEKVMVEEKKLLVDVIERLLND